MKISPVLISSSGARLIDAKGERAMRERLIPLAQIVTPNIPEAEALSGITIDSMAAMRAAARALRRMGARYVVIKGGHPLSGDFLRKAIGAPTLGEHLYRLRRALTGSRYWVVAHPGDEYELTVTQG